MPVLMGKRARYYATDADEKSGEWRSSSSRPARDGPRPCHRPLHTHRSLFSLSCSFQLSFGSSGSSSAASSACHASSLPPSLAGCGATDIVTVPGADRMNAKSACGSMRRSPKLYPDGVNIFSLRNGRFMSHETTPHSTHVRFRYSFPERTEPKTHPVG